MNPARPVLFAARAVKTDGRVVRMEIEGELDLATSPQLEGLMRRELDAGNELVLDLSKVTFMDSSGLRTIISMLRPSGTNGAPVTVTGRLLPQIQRLIEITGVQEVLAVAED